MITAKNAANRQAGGQGDRLGQAGGGATADANDRVDVVPRGDFAGAGGHVGRDVHRHMVVPEHDAQVSVTVSAVSNLPLERDHHDPGWRRGRRPHAAEDARGCDRWPSLAAKTGILGSYGNCGS